MNKYKYIVFQIQDMSNAELIHSVIESGYEDGEYRLSKNPLQYFIEADKLDRLETVNEIMEAALSNIYEVNVDITDGGYEDEDEDVIIKAYPAYFDSFSIYNREVEVMKHNLEREKARKNKKAILREFNFISPKKLPKGRFQVLQSFTNSMPSEIEQFMEF